MPDDPETRLALRQAGELRTDIANFESGLEIVMIQLARLPKRGEIWCAVVMSMLGGSVLTTALGLAFFLR
jgi:hypothetical protein